MKVGLSNANCDLLDFGEPVSYSGVWLLFMSCRVLLTEGQGTPEQLNTHSNGSCGLLEMIPLARSCVLH